LEARSRVRRIAVVVEPAREAQRDERVEHLPPVALRHPLKDPCQWLDIGRLRLVGEQPLDGRDPLWQRPTSPAVKQFSHQGGDQVLARFRHTLLPGDRGPANGAAARFGIAMARGQPERPA
jgi:hypothetical protein